MKNRKVCWKDHLDHNTFLFGVEVTAGEWNNNSSVVMCGAMGAASLYDFFGQDFMDVMNNSHPGVFVPIVVTVEVIKS